MPRELDPIEGCPITVNDDDSIEFTARFRIDTDGSGSSHGDKWHQADTTLHLDDKPLDADVDRFIVLPPQIINAVPGIVLGSQAFVEHNGIRSPAVVGDVGPRRRLGEGSRALAIALGINPDPNHGGEDFPTVHFRIFPGISADVNGKHYALQPYRD